MHRVTQAVVRTYKFSSSSSFISFSSSSSASTHHNDHHLLLFYLAVIVDIVNVGLDREFLSNLVSPIFSPL